MQVSSTTPSSGIGNENVYQNDNYSKKSVKKIHIILFLLLHLLISYILDPDLYQEARFDHKSLKCGSKRGDGSSEDIIFSFFQKVPCKVGSFFIWSGLPEVGKFHKISQNSPKLKSVGRFFLLHLVNFFIIKAEQ